MILIIPPNVTNPKKLRQLQDRSCFCPAKNKVPHSNLGKSRRVHEILHPAILFLSSPTPWFFHGYSQPITDIRSMIIMLWRQQQTPLNLLIHYETAFDLSTIPSYKNCAFITFKGQSVMIWHTLISRALCWLSIRFPDDIYAWEALY